MFPNLVGNRNQFSRSCSLKSLGKKNFRKVTHCIFDMDGTLLDTEVIYQKMISELCEKYGQKIDKELNIAIYGGTDHDICMKVCKSVKLPISVDEFEKQLTDMAKKSLPGAPLQKGAYRLLKHLSDYKIPLALATNSTEQAVRLQALSRPEIFGMFHHTVSATDPEVDRGKPNPDIFITAASRFKEKPKPNKCLVFEDSAVGVKAANDAGMQVIMIPPKKYDRELTRQATLVLRSLMDFKPTLFGLPPFDDKKFKKATT